jgi:hypothetical protein
VCGDESEGRSNRRGGGVSPDDGPSERDLTGLETERLLGVLVL